MHYDGDGGDQHPVASFLALDAYTAEAKYFNCRDQPFHKSMETSPDVVLRMIAASINPDVVAEARKAFGK